MIVGVVALDRGFLDCAVHALDLAVGPRVVRLGKPVVDLVCAADHVEPAFLRVDRVAIAWLLGELDSVSGQDRVKFVGKDDQHLFQELARCGPGCLVIKPLTCPPEVRSV